MGGVTEKKRAGWGDMKKIMFICVLLSALATNLCGAESFESSKTPKSTSLQAGDKNLSICSFNIRIFSNENRGDEELNYITDILKNYDVTAIQELRDQEILDRTVSMLRKKGINYGYDISGEVGTGIKERYAFLYRKDKVRIIKRGRLYQDTNDEFIREPFYATFKAGNFDFTIITILANGRRPEIIKLAKVYQEIQNEDPNEQDIILCGDFNLPADDMGFDRLKSISSMIYLIKPPAKTTISDKRWVDNFWFQKEYLKEYTGKYGINYFDEKMFSNDDTFAERAVSDHRPIWAIFDVRGEDDD